MPATMQNSPVNLSDTVHFEKERGVTEVQVLRGIAHVTAELHAETLAADRLAVLQSLAAAGIPIFLIKLHPTGISFALREDKVEAGEKLLLRPGEEHLFQFRTDLVSISVIAGAMRDLSGIIAAIYEALVAAEVPVRQTGDAYNAVLLLVDGPHSDRAANALREKFGLPTAEEPGV